MRENGHKRSLKSDIGNLKNLMPWIGDLDISKINMGTLQPWLEHRNAQNLQATTINHGLKVVRRILNLASSEWMDEQGLTWIAAASKLSLLPEDDKRPPYPLDWEEQDRLLKELPTHLQEMALFKVNVGCRDSEVCELRWSWEVPIPEMDTSVFIIPKEYVKNKKDRLVVLNQIAHSVIESRRGKHPTHVFSYKGKPVLRMGNSAWQRARKRAELPDLHVHDLKHTFGRRLRAAGVSFEDRQDLLGHKSSRKTTHYSAVELDKLIEAANKICERSHSGVALVLIKQKPTI